MIWPLIFSLSTLEVALYPLLASIILSRHKSVISALFPWMLWAVFLLLLSRFAFYPGISTIWLWWALVRASSGLFCLVFIDHRVSLYLCLIQFSNLLVINSSNIITFPFSLPSPYAIPFTHYTYIGLYDII